MDRKPKVDVMRLFGTLGTLHTNEDNCLQPAKVMQDNLKL